MFTKVVCLLIHVVLPNLNGGSVCAFAAHTGHINAVMCGAYSVPQNSHNAVCDLSGWTVWYGGNTTNLVASEI